MKKIILSFALIFVFTQWVFANGNYISRSQWFDFLATSIENKIPESYQYISLQYTGITKDSRLEDALQKLVYLDKIKNNRSYFAPNTKLKTWEFKELTKHILDLDIIFPENQTYVEENDLKRIHEALKNTKKDNTSKNTIKINFWGIESNNNLQVFWKKQNILIDVYKTINNEYYDRNKLNEDQLLEWAIKGLADGVGDRYTNYFPATESKELFESLDGEFEWIGAYVEMPKPGEFFIVSPIVGSPAEASGLRGGDRIIQVDDKKITDKNTQKEIVSWIKWPAWSSVTLTVLREGIEQAFQIQVVRKKIIIKDVEYEKKWSHTAYIQIKNFGEHVADDLKNTLKTIHDDRTITKIIFDLRNNPGGYLDQVSGILSYFLKEWEPTAVVNYGKLEQSLPSKWDTQLNLSNYKIIFLQNKGTASASEIMIWTLKDYFPKSIIVGEQSYGKGSVQSLKQYYDGSTLKYTSAKWFTGKTHTGIDGVGITPDIPLEYDAEKYKTVKIDNQLQKALDL